MHPPPCLRSVFPGNPGEEIVLCRVPGLWRGKELVLACLESTARIKKKKKKSAEECASHNLQACSLWFWEHLAALGYFQSKGRHITLPPQSGEKPECFSLCNTLYFTFLFSDQNKHLAKFSSVAGFCLLGVPKPFG